MDRLRALFSRLGFIDVETYLTSGNVIFETAPVGLVRPLAAQIARHLRRSLDDEAIWTFIRTPAELADIVARVPFEPEEIEREGSSLFVVLLSEHLDEHAEKQVRIRRNDVDELKLSGREIYWLRRQHDEKVPPPPLSEFLDAHATVRSFHTIQQLADKYGDRHSKTKPKSGTSDSTESARSRQ